MDRLQELGRACYKRKDYAKALEHFDRAIGRGPTVQLLDNRAACHEKVGNLPAALKDAKKAIQLQREDATGYLRAGKVLIKMEKQSVALELYSHGLKSIKHVGQGYEVCNRTVSRENERWVTTSSPKSGTHRWVGSPESPRRASQRAFASKEHRSDDCPAA